MYGLTLCDSKDISIVCPGPSLAYWSQELRGSIDGSIHARGTLGVDKIKIHDESRLAKWGRSKAVAINGAIFAPWRWAAWCMLDVDSFDRFASTMNPMLYGRLLDGVVLVHPQRWEQDILRSNISRKGRLLFEGMHRDAIATHARDEYNEAYNEPVEAEPCTEKRIDWFECTLAFTLSRCMPSRWLGANSSKTKIWLFGADMQGDTYFDVRAKAQRKRTTEQRWQEERRLMSRIVRHAEERGVSINNMAELFSS